MILSPLIHNLADALCESGIATREQSEHFVAHIHAIAEADEAEHQAWKLKLEADLKARPLRKKIVDKMLLLG